jgi:hypothetical protein
MPETIAQVCWWHLKAEEIRTEAEDFTFHSAKRTMLDVAAGWDRMADNLERHLSRHPENLYGAYRSDNRLGKWAKGEGKFPLAPKEKSALEFSGWALLGVLGLGLILMNARTLGGNGSVIPFFRWEFDVKPRFCSGSAGPS